MRDACAKLNNGLQGGRRVLRTMYELAYPKGFNNFDSDLLKLYNLCRNDVYMEPSTCPDNSNLTIMSRSAIYSLEALQNKFSDEFFIELYLMFRFAEEESTFSETKRELMIKRVINYFHADRLEAGLFEFERILNKPFDYVGSLTYNSKARKIQNQNEAFDEITARESPVIMEGDNYETAKVDG